MNRISTYIRCLFSVLLTLILGVHLASAQKVGKKNDGSALNDTTKTVDSDALRGEGMQSQSEPSVDKPEQEGQVNFQATDSLTFKFKEGRIATLYGSSKVIHSSGKLEAGKIDMDLDDNLVSANTQTPQDTLSQPVLTRDGKRIRSNKIDFNYSTNKGRFKVARVEVQNGKLTGTKVKNTTPHVVFLEDAIYSTCKLDHPHYYIKADRMKVVDQEEVFFQHARLYILDIPYPIIFPFGYLPASIDKKQSGLMAPKFSFQDRSNRGIGLQDFGWFQYFNDYLTARASLDIFTSGSFFIDTQTNYSIRNKLNGNVQLGYSRDNSGLEATDPDFSSTIQKQLRISHSQQFSPYASFNTSINLRTQDFYKQNSTNPTERAETSTSSNIRYNYKQPAGNFSFDASIAQNQNFVTNVTSISGPKLSFSVNRFSPFKDEESGRNQSKWYEKISLSYDNSFKSNYDFNPIRKDSARYGWFESLQDPDKYREATGDSDLYQFGFQQKANIGMNQILPSQYLNMSINGGYSEYWLPTTIRKSFDADSNEVVSRKVRGFATAREFNASLSFSTTLYGLMDVSIGDIKSFRHTLRPRLSLNYSPDFGSDYWGFYRTVQTDTARADGTIPTRRYSIFENEVFSGPRPGEQRSLSFGLGNVLEMKKVSRDSTGESKEEVVRLIDRFDLNSSYNFAADSLKLSNLSTNLSAGILPGLDIRAGANFNFYERNDEGRKVDRFLIADSRKLLELTSFNTGTSYSIKLGDQGLEPNNDYHFPAQYDPLNQRLFSPVDRYFNRRPVESFSTPFSASLDLSYRWSLNPNGENNKSATINASNISFRLTPKWKFRTQIGYDFIEKKLTPSQFSLNRKLHKWNLSFTINPFGDDKYYFFSLSLSTGKLQGIIQKLPGLNNLERGSRPTGRAPRGF